MYYDTFKFYTPYVAHSSVSSAKAKPTKKYVIFIVCKHTYVHVHVWGEAKDEC